MHLQASQTVVEYFEQWHFYLLRSIRKSCAAKVYWLPTRPPPPLSRAETAAAVTNAAVAVDPIATAIAATIFVANAAFGERGDV